ncbi:MAG: tRNA guanosine(34) transglycosylase Tgt [Bacteroidales bacterium]|jgi:queuine tRNA-ribosyltransferase|nr:tRNA guanosine(34) transglycosylase Tgt [Bacteroidales bacterium]MDD4702854.1 tRNA guanosine(34) transglycosylase Tgt [Bacteroidales bacterium]MDX9797461.1 tRNA guanosine(34) transglycosylase Tgt [Bacteroidales bacterium]
MKFTIDAISKDCNARAGTIKTFHGDILTPIFMPVGTVGSVKAVHVRELKEDIKAQIILGNTYHLYLRPGVDIIHEAGGIQRFNSWNKPMLTDSGGYQVYSLGHNRKITEDGVVFRSHIDGSKHIFTPEKVIDIQRKIGADIIMAFDECTPYPCDYDYAKKSLLLTDLWLDRCLKRFNETECPYGYSQSLFPIVQGSVYKDLRRESCERVMSYDCEANAIGGLSVGEPIEDMYELTDYCCSILPKEKPRYLMGVGTPANLLECIALGIDMFDCVMPSRNGRNGMLFTSEGIMNMKNEKWKNDFSPIDPMGVSYVDSIYSKAYLRHLFVAKEILALQIASIHNLSFYLWLVGQAREHIIAGDFHLWKKEMVKKVSNRL